MAPLTQNNIRDAVSMWIMDPDKAETTYGHISDWDTSNITDMSNLFYNNTTFNSDISKWDTSKVTNMSYMFSSCNVFNQNINTKSVTVNGTTYNAWDTSEVTDMDNMFYYCQVFNQDIGAWNTSKVTNMKWMFAYCQVFNQDIGAWNTSEVTNMGGMFALCQVFNQDIGAWNTSKVTDMYGMFWECFAFNHDISTKKVGEDGDAYLAWNTSKVTNMSYMFGHQPSDDAGGINMYSMSFNNGQEDEKPLNWNTSKVTDMKTMFQHSVAYNQEMNSKEVTVGGVTYTTWNTSKVTDMRWMFSHAAGFNQDIGDWDISNVTIMSYMFYNNPALSNINKCAIQESFKSQKPDIWPFDWSEWGCLSLNHKTIINKLTSVELVKNFDFSSIWGNDKHRRHTVLLEVLKNAAVSKIIIQSKHFDDFKWLTEPTIRVFEPNGIIDVVSEENKGAFYCPITEVGDYVIIKTRLDTTFTITVDVKGAENSPAEYTVTGYTKFLVVSRAQTNKWKDGDIATFNGEIIYFGGVGGVGTPHIPELFKNVKKQKLGRNTIFSSGRSRLRSQLRFMNTNGFQATKGSAGSYKKDVVIRRKPVTLKTSGADYIQLKKWRALSR